MANVIAVIWDFDKTLVDGYMQDPIFEAYGIDAKDFWKEVNTLPTKLEKEQNIKINTDTYYLNHFINKTKEGVFDDLSNAKLKAFGKKLKFYDGVPDIFKESKKEIESKHRYKEYGIRVEHYIISTGFAQMIKGSSVMEFVECVWGCELIEEEYEKGKIRISEIAYTIDNTTKTRALFEINKGVNKYKEINVNTKIPNDQRRVHFKNMIYIADGPSDIPAFSVIKKNGGETFAIYPKHDEGAFKQVEQMRKDGRVSMYAEADYSKGTTAYMWIIGKIKEFADRICETEKAKLTSSLSETPKHLI